MTALAWARRLRLLPVRATLSEAPGAAVGQPSLPSHDIGCEVVQTIERLDDKIAECDRAASDDELRRVFGTFRMQPPKDMPDDPFSSEYRDFQLDFYSRVAGKAYMVANEATIFDVAAALRRPFPFSTGSSKTVADSMISTGFILRTMRLPAGSRVLELGSGWGTMTVALAMLGHSVTALDVEPRFCELMRRRAVHDELAVTIVNADFGWVEDTDQTFDAVLFTSSFHHAADHLRLLTALHRVLVDDGRVFFGSEPIHADLAYPWGLRLDGQSLWSIRKHGWLELGFSERYFAEALRRTGWFASKHVATDPKWLTVWEAQKRCAAVLRFTAGDGRLATEVGRFEADAIVLDQVRSGIALFGPYVTLPADRYVARLAFRRGSPSFGQGLMDVVVDAGRRQLAAHPFRVDELSQDLRVVELPFESSDELSLLEVRLFCEEGFSAVIDHVEIALAG